MINTKLKSQRLANFRELIYYLTHEKAADMRILGTLRLNRKLLEGTQ